MRLLVLNPNTSEAVSARLRMVLSSGLTRGEQLRVETAASGLPYIGDVAAMAVGAQAARARLRDVMAEASPFDVVLLGCFADLDTAGLQALAERPAVSLLGASVRLAARAGQRWAVVTAGAGWRGLLFDMFATAIKAQGVQGSLVSVRTFEAQDPAIAGDPLRMQAEITRLAQLCADEDHADVVIVGGAGLGGLAPTAPVGRNGISVLDSVMCGLHVARELMHRESQP
ncbi:Asp/Glu racemase [Bordetella sputigena]|uniref:aspartate/glutamate racemase family protein n=1 Tax=Bordetella sputigena TaxID=1416810 RepID=UPI0039F0D4E4